MNRSWTPADIEFSKKRWHQRENDWYRSRTRVFGIKRTLRISWIFFPIQKFLSLEKTLTVRLITLELTFFHMEHFDKRNFALYLKPFDFCLKKKVKQKSLNLKHLKSSVLDVLKNYLKYQGFWPLAYIIY